MTSKILVTGGAGYIGSMLVPVLLQEGYEVTVLDNFMYKQVSLAYCCAHTNFTLVRGDCRHKDLMERLVGKADIIIPLAALVGAPLCKEFPLEAESTNLDAIIMLMGMLSTNQRVLMPITNSGYGIGDAGKMCTEDSPLKPVSLYGMHKVRAEAAALERVNSVSFRLATVFGMSPRPRLDLLVNDFVYRAMYDKSIVLFEGHFKRNYIHVRDVVRTFLMGLINFEQMRGNAYNVGLSTANLSKLELCAVIQKHVPEFAVMEANIGEDPDKRDYIVSNEKLEALGWRALYSLDDGIQELIKGYTMLKNTIYTNI